MSGFLPADSKVYLLSQLATQGLYVGLATDLPSGNDVTLANITECVTPGYARTAVGGWSTPTSSNFAVNPIQMTNTADVNFPSVTADMTPCPYAFITDQATAKAIAVPVITLGTTSTSGGTFAAGTYYWTVTAINAKGETIASNQLTATLVSTGRQQLNWSTITGATGYNIYRGTASGATNVLVATVGVVTTYTDTGTAGVSQSPPALNTAALGRVLWVWTLAEPVTALSGKPVKAPATGLVIE